MGLTCGWLCAKILTMVDASASVYALVRGAKMRLVGIIILQLSAYASILGLYFTVSPFSEKRPNWHWVMLAIFAILCLMVIVREVKNHLARGPKVYGDPKKINKFMRGWVSSGGRALVFSRDLSWARDPETKEVLMKKALAGDLTIYLEKDIPISDEFKRAGANIITYDRSGHIPRSRFTIIDYEKDGARVAIGCSRNGKQIIEEFESGGHPLFAVAEDLAKFIGAYNKQESLEDA
jgi:hypothetical protein